MLPVMSRALNAWTLGLLARCFGWWCCLAGCLSGQGQFTFRMWQSEDGMPVNLVHSVVQGSAGYLWIATSVGVVRFDGLDFDPVAMPDGYALPSLGPNRLFAHPDGAVWFATSRGDLLKLDELQATRVEGMTSSAEHGAVSQVIPWRGGVVACRGDEYWRIKGTRAELLTSIDFRLSDAIAKNRFAREKSGRLGPDGAPGNLVDRSGSRWVAGDPGGLEVISPEGVSRRVGMPAVGSDFQVTEMLEDREGNIWVATTLHGIGMFREDRVDVINAADGLSRATVLAVTEDAAGRAWIANRSGVVDVIDGDSIEHHTLPPGQGPVTITALYEDRNGRMWAATRQGPLFRWLGWRFVEQFIGRDDPSRVNAMYHDSAGTMWFGGVRGLVKMTGQRVARVGPEAGFPGGEVTVMGGGVDGELWLGTVDGFVLRDVNGRLQRMGTPSDLAHRRVSGILVEAPDRVWVTTLGSGLFLYDGSGWRRFDREQGLPDAQLTHVVADEVGHLWFGSTGGIIRASRADLLARADDREAPIHWLRMDRADGLPTRECVGGHNPAGHRFRDGSIWFPTTLGVVRLDPTQTKVNRTPPPVYLTRVRVDGTVAEIPEDGLHLEPGNKRFEFGFHGLHFSAPEKVTYRTRMVGLDDTWQEIGARREARFDPVPPGEYRFEVLAMNGDGVLSQSPAALDIVVPPHFWQTDGFVAQMWILALGLAAAVGSLIARIRFKRRLAKLKVRSARDAERARIARDLHDDLGASLTEISLLAGLSAEHAAGSDFQAELEALSDRSRAVALALDEIVWAVNPREDHFGSLIDYLASFATEFMDRAGIQLRLRIPPGLPDAPMDTTLRHSVFLSVREAFNNLVKHSEATTAWLRVAIDGRMVEISIEDDGRGLPEDPQGGGHGLENFHQRMQSCGGECVIEPREGGGTVVRFRVPLLARSSESS